MLRSTRRTLLPIHIDTNVPIYTAGRPHPLKAPCQEITRLLAASPSAFATDAEVFQELLHYYIAGRNWGPGLLGETVFRAFATLMGGRVEPVAAADVIAAAGLAAQYPRLSARDLLHVAVMQRTGALHIVSADQDFDGVQGIQRLDPAHVATWRRQLGL